MTTVSEVAAPVVATSQGAVRGVGEAGISIFRGIPYAEPPVGALRFRPPVRRAPWDGVRDATAFTAIHPQDTDPVEGYYMSRSQRPPEGEDCLSLNVWTPELNAAGLPVFVWFHGGSLKFGTGADAVYDGRVFARDGIVCVTCNYRLHPAGYLNVGDRPGTGAFGVLDQVAVLEWVRENIAAFGGDPGQVTIAGESAGAHSVGTLLAVPAARGLFRRAILQSGHASFDIPSEASRIVGEAVLSRLGDEASDSDELLEASRAVEAQMLPLLAEHGVRPPLMSVITGVASLVTYGADVVPVQALDAVAGGSARGIDLLIGTNVDEVTMFGPEFLAVAPRVAEHAGIAIEGDVRDFLTDALFRIPAIRLAEAARRHHPATYMYLFAFASPPRDGRLGAMHGLDLPFTWNTFGEVAEPILDAVGRRPQHELADTVHGAWAAFVKTGVPAHEGLPEWPRYEPQRRATMRLDEESAVLDDPMAGARRRWADVAF